ncbi:MAG TPA: LysE family translocator [Kiloniellales bacterium]|nr:LysE family translocator [Kiloniellales bacterium]
MGDTVTGVDWSWAFSAAAFALAMSATPGPNNAMVAASGATWGVRRTWWHILGISIGFPVMIVAVALGAGAMLERNPEVHEALKWIGAAYMVWLAWHIATAVPAASADGSAASRRGRPLRFHEAALFQWINPKAWIITAGALATYTQADSEALLMQVAALAVIFFLACVPSVLLWTLIGAGVAHLFRTARAIRLFNVAMAILLVASLVPVFL